MAGFSELVSKFENIREYMRDFFIYGFKKREDFSRKSLRTYDNEKRRIESYMGQYVRWDYTKEGKSSFISLDSSVVTVNPFFAVWKAKRFSKNDIILHFGLLEILKVRESATAAELADEVSMYTDTLFDAQTVRNKCNEYVKLGIIEAEKDGKTIKYHLSQSRLDVRDSTWENLMEAVTFFQGESPFGVVGSYIMDKQGLNNRHYNYKHKFLMYTLEDGVLLDLVKAIREKKYIEIGNISRRSNNETTKTGIPLKILVSTHSGRRYLCLCDTYMRYYSYRLDSITSVKLLNECDRYDDYMESFRKYHKNVWGASLSSGNNLETVCLKLKVDYIKEDYIIDRLKREGQGGEVLLLGDDVVLYTIHVHDANEMSTWIKTYIGRIISLETTNTAMYNRFYDDVKRMYDLYSRDEEEKL